ncbi:MAG: cyclic-di-AMP receptor [Chloroflexi bacterium]|nr:cyclic-di-AMP receptor [Chloroflexota bacterium]MCL5108143.1 cyclic-di-AMP receptor [Chloroflexota bacterium]
MKLILAIVQNEDAGGLLEALSQKGYRSTRMNTAGGFLKESNATVVLGVEESQVEDVLAVIRANCHTRTQYLNPLPPVMEPGEFYMPYPVEVQVGGATLFVLDVENYRQL